MKEECEHLFQLYLKICEEHRNPDTEKQLINGIRMVGNLKNELYGMITLMKEMNVLSCQEAENEQERIRKTFSSISLFGAYIEDGELYIFREINKNVENLDE